MMDILVIVALVFAGIIAHNMYNNHPTAVQMKILTKIRQNRGAAKREEDCGRRRLKFGA